MHWIRPVIAFIACIVLGITVVIFLPHPVSSAPPNAEPNQPLQILKLNETCTIPYDRKSGNVTGYTIRLTRAIRIPTLTDVITKFYYVMESLAPDIGLDDFIILEGTFTYNRPATAVLGIIDIAYIARLVRQDSIYAPWNVGYNNGPLYRNQSLIYAAFPVRPSEKTFNLHVCDFRSPTKVFLDFSKAETRIGNFSKSNGIILKNQ